MASIFIRGKHAVSFISLVNLCEDSELPLFAKISPQIRTVSLRTHLVLHKVNFFHIFLFLETASKQDFFLTLHSCSHLMTEQKKPEFHSNNA